MVISDGEKWWLVVVTMALSVGNNGHLWLLFGNKSEQWLVIGNNGAQWCIGFKQQCSLTGYCEVQLSKILHTGGVLKMAKLTLWTYIASSCVVSSRAIINAGQSETKILSAQRDSSFSLNKVSKSATLCVC